MAEHAKERDWYRQVWLTIVFFEFFIIFDFCIAIVFWQAEANPPGSAHDVKQDPVCVTFSWQHCFHELFPCRKVQTWTPGRMTQCKS